MRHFDMEKKIPRVDEVILTQVQRGAGEDRSDPCRTVTRVHEKDGTFIAEYDPCENVGELKARLDHAERLLRSLRQIERLCAFDKEQIDSFFDPRPL